MKSKLKALPDEKLREIAMTFGYYGDRDVVIYNLVRYFKRFEVRWSDIQSRFSL
jgi:hypothetical protein